MKCVCFLVPVNASPGLTLNMRTPASPRTGCLVLGLWVQLARTAFVCLQLLLVPFHPLIHSGRMAWMISFTFLVQATQEFHLDLSVPSLPDWMAYHGKSSLLRGPVSYTRRLQYLKASRPHVPPTSGLAAFLLLPLPPEPPYTAIAFFTLSNTLTKAWMPHLDAGLAPTPLDHPHLRHNPCTSSSLIDVHCRPSHCLPWWMLLMSVLPQDEGFLYRDPTTRVQR